MAQGTATPTTGSSHRNRDAMRHLVSVPHEMLEGIIAEGRLNTEGAAHYNTGIESGDNPNLTLTEEALGQIELINKNLPDTIPGLQFGDEGVVSFDDFHAFIERVRTFVRPST